MAESYYALLTLAQVATAESQQMGSLLLGLDKILYLVNRCGIYEILYARVPDLVEGLESLETALVKLYAVILRFLSKAIRQFENSTASRTLHSFWHSNGLVEFEQTCKAHEDQVERCAEICERLHNRTFRNEGQRSTRELHLILEELKLQKLLLVQVDTGVADLWNRSNDDEQVKILSWASDIPFLDHHIWAREGRTEGTGEWLLQNNQYRQWRLSNQSMILWLHGIRK